MNKETGLTSQTERSHLQLWAQGSEKSAIQEVRILGPLSLDQDPRTRRALIEFNQNRSLGLYVSGLPGTGKSTLLLHLILEDIQLGRACCVLDPHGDLITAVLERAPLTDKILVFDPSDRMRPVGLDILDAHSESEQELVIQFMLGLYEELFLAEHQGPVLHQSLTNGLRLLMETKGTLTELPLLFTDQGFLASRLVINTNPWVEHYFEEIWSGIRESRDGGEYLGYFTSKIARFIDDPVLRNILAQRKGPDWAGHLNQGGVVLSNLARGTVGDINARLLGMILLHKLERIALARVTLPASQRPPLHIYVDEFHEFEAPHLHRFLRAARKFNVALHLAHQNSELTAYTTGSVLGLVGHVAAFRQGSGAALHDFERRFWPRDVQRDLVGASSFQALLHVTSSTGASQVGRLRVPEPPPGSSTTAHALRTRSRRRFGRPRSVVERETLERLGWDL